MSESLKKQIALMLKQGTTPSEILAMLEPRANSTTSREVLAEIRTYLMTGESVLSDEPVSLSECPTPLVPTPRLTNLD